MAKIALPDTPQPVDDRTRLSLMLQQFGPEERQNFVGSYGNLPAAKQLEMIEQALAGAAMP